MNISGLSISGNQQRAPTQRTQQRTQQPRAVESKFDAEPALQPLTARTRSHMSARAEAQRANGGCDTSRFVLVGDGQHDVNKFTFREDPDWENVEPEAFGVSRAKYWNPQVENCFRIQQCGWRDVYEYRAAHSEPEIWRSTGLISKVYTKKTGYITYWQQERECPNAKLHLVKLFKYRNKTESKQKGEQKKESMSRRNTKRK
jgi:hypothetical protein